MALLRWELPSSGIPYDTKNGTALVSSVAKFFQVTEMEIVMATDPVYGNDKLRMIVLKGQEERIGSLGGHGFFIPHIPGNKQIDSNRARELKTLIHETDNHRKQGQGKL